MAGVEREARTVADTMERILTGAVKGMSREDLMGLITEEMPKASQEDQSGMADEILAGLAQNDTPTEIINNFVSAWKNEAVKDAHKKVDISVGARAGLLAGVPILTLVAGVSFYRKAIMKEDKDRTLGQSKAMNSLQGMQTIENPDIKDASMVDKLSKLLGTGFTVEA
jgi:hypothetical protein